ncbi:MAG: glycosyltransferase family 2 protein [Selenomonas sp.]|nr:glycosyltransferase family 2 protein [Selenomonas sp.]
MKNNFDIINGIHSNLVYEYIGNNYGESLITIAIPTYKRIDYFIDAFFSALDQKYEHSFQIIIVDNDDEKTYFNEKIFAIKNKINCNEYNNVKIKYYINEKNIAGNNFNRCMELADTEYVALLHDDDMLSKNYLKNMDKAVRGREIDAIGCELNIIDKNGKTYNKKNPISTLLKVFIDMISADKMRSFGFDFFIDRCTSFPGFMIKRKAAIASGGLDMKLGPATDYVWQWNVANRYKSYLLLKEDYNYRVAQNDSTKYETQLEICKMPCRLLQEYYSTGKINLPYCVYRFHASCNLLMLINNAKNIWAIDIDYKVLMKEFSLYKPDVVSFALWKIAKKLYKIIRRI